MNIAMKNTFILIARYAKHVEKTDQFKDRSIKDRRRISIHGLVSEIGSVVSAVKKQKLWEDDFRLTRDELREELGDVIWYCFSLATIEGIGDRDVLTRQLETLDERLKGGDGKSILLRRPLSPPQLEEFHSRAQPFLHKKQRTFRDFQDIAYLTARNHDDALVETCLSALMQLSAQLMRHLLSESERQLHDQLQDRPILDILGEIAWHLAAIATAYKLSFDEIVGDNIRKIQLRRSATLRTPLHDEEWPNEMEKLPRYFEVEFRTIKKGRSQMYLNGCPLGNELTDNFGEDDGYRFHDALHLANMAHLGWSPVLRGFMKRKRKSEPKVDEVQDGARAIIVEEAIVKVIHSEGRRIADILYPDMAPKDRPVFSDNVDIPFSLFTLIQRWVKGLEVEKNSFHEWKNAIRDGFRIYKKLAKHSQGTVIVDLDQRKITFRSKV